MRRLILSALCLISLPALAALHFPALTGRVVDDAYLLSASTRASLEGELSAFESQTGDQVVVATLPSLEGDSIEDYGYQLGRYWGIGQKGKDNGALLIVAPKERQVRIEVGYGLEPVLTDAISSEIVHGIILPDFKSGQMEKGVVDGTRAIIAVLGGQAASIRAPSPQTQDHLPTWEEVLIILLMGWFFFFCLRHPFLAMALLSTSRFGGNFGGGFGGFGGGGGSFGGGGASGSW